VGAPTKFELSTTLTVTLRRRDETPAAGTVVCLLNAGNNLICRVATGEDGVARMERLPAQVADLFVTGGSEWDRKEHIGTVDLRKGDLAVTHTLTPERRYEVTLLVDGEPRLPDGCMVLVDGAFQVSAERDAGNGRVTGSFVPRGPLVSFSLVAPGYRRLTESVQAPPGDDPGARGGAVPDAHDARGDRLGAGRGRPRRRDASRRLHPVVRDPRARRGPGGPRLPGKCSSSSPAPASRRSRRGSGPASP
jgi:hypothetical protein